MPYHLPVVVVAWPDGITPTAPSDDDGWIYTDDADEIAAAIDAGLRVDVHWPSADADEWVPLHASNRNSLAVGTLLAGGFTFRIAR